MSQKHIFNKETQKDGSFVQQKIDFSTPFGPEPGQLSVEANRYRLIWMKSCPHAHKVVITRELLGLDNVISLGTAGPYRTPNGWVFSNDPNGLDPVTKAASTQELYERAEPDFDRRPTVPLIVDETTGIPVNNDHIKMTLQLNTAWREFHKEGAPDLYPEALRAEIDALNQFIYEEINVGFYKVGFAESQSAYETAFDKLFESLDILEERLSNQRYLFGDQLTDSDIRLWPSLIRYDLVYYSLFRANKKRLRDYPNLWDYSRELFQMDAFKSSTDFHYIKDSYFRSPHLKEKFGNVNNILPKGPSESEWHEPVHRTN